jgi:transposase
MENNTDKERSEGQAEAKPEVIKLGLDLHARQVTECRQLDGSTPKPAQKWDPWKLLDQVEEWVKSGIKVYSCYEAGACGYWYHRKLIKRGAVNFVVVPRRLESHYSKRQKTDRLDARALLNNLESYLRGNHNAMSLVTVPSSEQEQQRSVARHREQLMHNRRRAEARGQALTLSQGIVAPVGWWRPAAWKEFKTQVPEWMVSQLQHWQEEALGIDAKERQVRQQLENMVSITLPSGVGALSWITLELEIRGWDRFKNRRQVASYTGLCPGIHNSNGRGMEGSINRCGNSVVRYTLIEMVWRMLRWQPDYPPIKKLRSTVSKRGKRRYVVAAARRLVIDLWRWATGRASAEKLGLALPSTMTLKTARLVAY